MEIILRKLKTIVSADQNFHSSCFMSENEGDHDLMQAFPLETEGH